MPTICRFGGFTFSSASGELDDGKRVTRLQPQVAALLGVLIESRGNVVTRTELQARLWPDSTVEFDDGLNFCIRQLRIALGDEANAPTYIETLPRRGYRFLPQVHDDLEPVAPIVAARSTPRRSRTWLGGAIAVVLLAAAAFAWNARSPAPRRPRIALEILPFSADTADHMLADYRARLLDHLMTSARTEHIWDLVDTSSGRATHVLHGSLTRDGNSVKLFVELVSASDRRKKLWADDIVDMYAFSGNSTMTADRIEKSVARILDDTTSGGDSRRK